jgi:DNA-binding transcriptional regulator YdaS (Cro superfamily)
MNTQANMIVDALGGTVKAASLCGITPSAVSQWRTNGIPKPWMSFLKLARPDVFRTAKSKPSKKAA